MSRTRLIRPALILGLVWSFAFPSVVAQAATEGCPDTWTLATNPTPSSSAKYVYDQLVSVKNLRPKGDVVITESRTRFVNWVGEEGSVAEEFLKELPIGRDGMYVTEEAGLRLRYLYGKSTVETTYSVAVRGCASVRNFVEQRVWLTSIPVEYATLEEWISSNRAILRDFTKEAALIEEMRKRESEWITSLKNSEAPYIWFPTIGLGGYLQEFLKDRPIGNLMAVIPMTPNCVGGFDGSTGSVPYVVKNRKCTFAFAIGAPGNTKLTILKKFEVDSRIVPTKENSNPSPMASKAPATPKILKITCIRGKVSKTISGAKPKCPAGYKKK